MAILFIKLKMRIDLLNVLLRLYSYSRQIVSGELLFREAEVLFLMTGSL
ncbi:hypothetical protein LZZ85_05730 [Terrimonas sp. NA20]|uniref:Cyclic nucleotide-binding domain-containing protein n=1 Tax=Terrimonas ginsenosidimutans TaxID=2908004 RepID=A0ABS9KN75_9BACT|nr:hypothetical protein [Terrimonas ginsenosidimutans]MCG2613768.1 hypothetical protein [Terrimonas ginsenosidimutans]